MCPFYQGYGGSVIGELLAGLMEQSVQIELCGATAAANLWGNADLLPGVKGQHQCNGESDGVRAEGIHIDL